MKDNFILKYKKNESMKNKNGQRVKRQEIVR